MGGLMPWLIKKVINKAKWTWNKNNIEIAPNFGTNDKGVSRLSV
jgi:hypothetical protein